MQKVQKLYGTVCMILLSGLCMALVLSPISSANAAKHDVETAEAYSKDFIDSLIATASRKGQTPDEQRIGVVRLVEENVDLKWAAKFVLGKYWRSLSSEQQTEFTNLYHDYLLHTYAPRFQGYAGESADVDFVEYVDENDYSVECVFYSKNGNETLVNLIVHYNDAEERFVIRELVVEGIGLLNTQRADFTASIANSGYNEFLSQMVSKIATLKEQSGIYNNLDKSSLNTTKQPTRAAQ